MIRIGDNVSIEAGDMAPKVVGASIYIEQDQNTEHIETLYDSENNLVYYLPCTIYIKAPAGSLKNTDTLKFYRKIKSRICTTNEYGEQRHKEAYHKGWITPSLRNHHEGTPAGNLNKFKLNLSKTVNGYDYYEIIHTSDNLYDSLMDLFVKTYPRYSCNNSDLRCGMNQIALYHKTCSFVVYRDNKPITDYLTFSFGGQLASCRQLDHDSSGDTTISYINDPCYTNK